MSQHPRLVAHTLHRLIQRTASRVDNLLVALTSNCLPVRLSARDIVDTIKLHHPPVYRTPPRPHHRQFRNPPLRTPLHPLDAPSLYNPCPAHRPANHPQPRAAHENHLQKQLAPQPRKCLLFPRYLFPNATVPL